MTKPPSNSPRKFHRDKRGRFAPASKRPKRPRPAKKADPIAISPAQRGRGFQPPRPAKRTASAPPVREPSPKPKRPRPLKKAAPVPVGAGFAFGRIPRPAPKLPKLSKARPLPSAPQAPGKRVAQEPPAQESGPKPKRPKPPKKPPLIEELRKWSKREVPPPKPVPRPAPRLLFKDSRGRFVSPKDRFTSDVQTIYISGPKGKIVPLSKEVGGKLTYKKLSMLMRGAVGDLRAQKAMDKLPPALVPVGEFQPHGNAVYKAWNLAGKMAKQRGIGGKLIKVTMHVKDGRQLRDIVFYHSLQKGKGTFQYQLWLRMNETIGNEINGAFYKQFRGKLITDRKGRRKVDLLGTDLEIVL